MNEVRTKMPHVVSTEKERNTFVQLLLNQCWTLLWYWSIGSMLWFDLQYNTIPKHWTTSEA